eukprot:11050888-Lingulodinium_polyedra.AAC.1
MGREPPALASRLLMRPHGLPHARCARARGGAPSAGCCAVRRSRAGICACLHVSWERHTADRRN